METIDHECYVSLEVAKLLKEAGFDWECREYYYNFTTTGWSLNFDDNFVNWNTWGEQYVSAPTLEVAQRWLRETKNIQITISPLVVIKKWTYLIAKDFWLLHEDVTGIALTQENFDTYELALDAGIKKVLEVILKNEK